MDALGKGMDQADTILIAVRDGILADSLRFSLELEGFETRFCDEHTLSPTSHASRLRGACLVLDQELFSRMEAEARPIVPSYGRLPVILMVSQKTELVLAEARVRGITEVLEKPVLGGVLLNTIRHVIGQGDTSGDALRAS